MKNTLFGKILSSGLQAIAVQVFGGVFFIIISFYLSKDYFGVINWANAVAMVLTMLLSFGMDQVVVRRIAASETSDWAATAYLMHAGAGSLVTFLILFGISIVPPFQDAPKIQLLPWLFLSQGLLFTAGPIKQLLNAKQHFKPYALIAIISNSAKLLAAYWLISTDALSVNGVMAILVICGLFELLALLIYSLVKKKLDLTFRRTAYLKLLKEAAPQYVAVLFDASLARIDWILLGIISTPAASAEYGLAYRAYEIAKLPLTVLSPILLARFAKVLMVNTTLSEGTQKQVKDLFVLEMFFATMIPLVLNILWAPVLDDVFKGKYGSVNAMEFMILSICIPIQFYINLLWTLSFSARKYKQISTIIASTAFINIGLNAILIPFYGGMGAAIAFLVTSVMQLVGYYRLSDKYVMKFSSLPLFSFLLIGAVSYIAAVNIISALWMQVGLAVFLYVAIALVLRQVNTRNVKSLLTLLKK